VTTELRPVPDYPALLASDDGHVFKQYDDGTLRRLPERVRDDGYVVVDAKKGGKWAPRTVHRLVAAAFIRKPEGPWEVTRHLDNDRRNNSASNLRLGSPADNSLDAVQAGRTRKGSAHPNSRLTEADVEAIRHAIGMKVRYRIIAEHFGITPSTVCDIHRGRTWRRESTAVAAVPP
jgi:hypothetical protein